MMELSGNPFREILKNIGYRYVVTSKSSESIDINFPNMPGWYRGEFEEWRHETLPEATVINNLSPIQFIFNNSLLSLSKSTKQLFPPNLNSFT